ncbi:sodium-dependent phosphate transporter [Halalkalibacter wakoensis JCM 9140]|uniref:Sodium-dependent phosphate transporter n=1 Tax=Halalkalibacter wakoensis JCM 9140 TaxID=1236970 RepID=W4Q4Q6_9BACI|nr:Na/Pi symporter [Halalkalibacter wakoensis]GAE26967.1 sodium-dependent phosphate transporter [Halalkalibacter wakoensis JCM 9140]
MVKELVSLLAVFIALFLFGMVVMRAGLFHIGQASFKNILHRLTNSAWKGLIVGAIATAILQSSSAIIIMTVGLVATGLLAFRHSIGIILGANIGTTMTTELLALDLSMFIVPLLGIGLVSLFIPNKQTYSLGCLSFGLACIFIAMDGLETLAYPLSAIPAVHSFFDLTNEHQLVGIGIGTVLTAIIQSSTATTAIAMGFMTDHVLDLPAGIAIMLGANIGTCITAYLASIGSGRSAKLVAYANIWLNVFGVLLFIPLIGWLSTFASSLTPSPMMQLAHASLIFNVICSIILLPFVAYFAKFIEWLHTEKAT